MAEAKTAVDNANSAKTEALVQRAIRALSAAVDRAEAAKTAAQDDLDDAQAALTEAQDYRTAQAAILDGLRLVGASASLAAVEPASTTLAFNAKVALGEAKRAVANARRTRTEASISRARRALSEAVQKARESFDAATAVVLLAEADLTAARNYRDEQTPRLNSIPFTQPLFAPPEQPSSPPGEFNVTHVELSFYYSLNRDPYYRISTVPSPSTFDHLEARWRQLRDDARDLENGFGLFLRRNSVAGSGARVNGIIIAQKNSRYTNYFPEDYPLRTPSGGIPVLSHTIRNDIVGMGDYSAFLIFSWDERFAQDVWRFSSGSSSVLGERSVRAPNWTRPGLNPQTNLRFVYRGAMAGVKISAERASEHFTGTATLTYRPNIAGDRINLALREHGGPWMLERDMSPNNDGSFSDASNSVKGDFYGPNWDEAAGIVQTRDVYGGWLVHRPFEFQGGSSSGPVLGQHTGPPFALNDFIQ